MNLRFLLLISLLYAKIVSGQNISDSLLTSFYNRTLTDIFSDQFLFPEEINIIRTECDTTNLIKFINRDNEVYKLTYIDTSRKLEDVLLKASYYQYQTYRLYPMVKHNDTVDIKFEIKLVNRKNRKKFEYYTQCAGNYEPPTCGRFIYNKSTNKWTFMNRKEINAEWLKDRKH
jgi:hypothetical protein